MADSVGGSRPQSQATGARQKHSRKKGARSSDVSEYKSSAEVSVRYKGSKTSSVYTSSEEYFEYSCDPCSTAGDRVEAQGFCTNCGEYLCGTCFKSHSRGKATRRHTLLDRDNMPRKHVKTCDPCKSADEDKEAEGYCVTCEEYLCGDCFKSHSRSKATKSHNLVDKDNIPETSNALTTSFDGMNIREEGADYQKSCETYTYIKDISIKSEKDEADYLIVDMVSVSNYGLLMTDNTNNLLKLLDIENNVLKDTLKFKTKPAGITKTSKDQVALVLPEEQTIAIISVSAAGLSVVRTLKANGYCLDIVYINGKLYVSYQKPIKFQIQLYPSGAECKTINPSPEVQQVCVFPAYIAVSLDEKLIYVSDGVTNNVMCIDTNGNLIYLYQGELSDPGGITISPSGSVYLCNIGLDGVYKLKSDLSEGTVVLGRRDGLEFPAAMCFNAAKRNLFISSRSRRAEYANFIKVYQWQ